MGRRSRQRERVAGDASFSQDDVRSEVGVRKKVTKDAAEGEADMPSSGDVGAEATGDPSGADDPAHLVGGVGVEVTVETSTEFCRERTGSRDRVQLPDSPAQGVGASAASDQRHRTEIARRSAMESVEQLALSTALLSQQLPPLSKFSG